MQGQEPNNPEDHPFYGLRPSQMSYFMGQANALEEQGQMLEALQATVSLLQQQHAASAAAQANLQPPAANETPSTTQSASPLRTEPIRIHVPSYVPNYLASSSRLAKDPDTFHGKRDKLKAFLTQMQIYLHMNSSKFRTEEDKVLFVTSYLRDTAFEWCEPLLRDYFEATEENPLVLSSVKALFDALTVTFGDIDTTSTAERQIQALMQKTSASTYASLFQQISSHLDWNDEALQFHYYRGLKDRVKDELARSTKPDSFAKLIETSIKIDNRLYERQLEKSSSIPNLRTFAGNRANTFKKPKPYYGAQPMELDASLPSSSRGRLTEAERKHRMDKRLCLYCGKPNHIVSQCPSAPQPSSRSVSASNTSASQSTASITIEAKKLQKAKKSSHSEAKN